MAKYKERVQLGETEKWVTGNTRHELHLAIAKALLEGGMMKVDGYDASAASVPTVREFVEQVYRDTYIIPLAPKTIENYDAYLRYNIFPFLGDMRMDQVKVSTIQQFYNWMATAASHGRKKNLNARTIERVSGLTSRIFKIAMELDLIKEFPFKKSLLTIRAEDAGHHKPLPDEEIHRIKQEISHLENPMQRVFMGLLAYTGMRCEEILGLRWENVFLDEEYCEITHTVTHPRNSKPHIRTGGKSKSSCRTVILPQPLLAILKEIENKTGFLLGGEQPLSYSGYQRMRHKAFKNLNITGFDNHDFRTTYATQLCELGISSKEVADLLGHADTRMVETIYARRRHEGVMKHSKMLNQMNSDYQPAPVM